MHKIIIFNAILATALAAPGYYLTENYHVPLAKSTFTTSSQAVDHGSTHVLHAPVYSAKTTVTKSTQAVDHGSTHVLASVPHALHAEYHVPLKTTVTNSKQIVNHGGTEVVHAPVLPVLHTSLVHAPVVHTPVSYHAPLLYRTGDSAVSHHTSSVHETVPVVHHLPLYAFH